MFEKLKAFFSSDSKKHYMVSKELLTIHTSADHLYSADLPDSKKVEYHMLVAAKHLSEYTQASFNFFYPQICFREALATHERLESGADEAFDGSAQFKAMHLRSNAQNAHALYCASQTLVNRSAALTAVKAYYDFIIKFVYMKA